MKITVERFQDNGDTTLSKIYIDGEFECYGLEDEERTKKVYGETRVPEGVYTIKRRQEGGHHEKYLERYGSGFHRGMLCVSNAPNYKLIVREGDNSDEDSPILMSFQYILIHIGNDDDDTSGCLLVGKKIVNDDFIGESANAYHDLYEKVITPLVSGIDVEIEYLKIY